MLEKTTRKETPAFSAANRHFFVLPLLFIAAMLCLATPVFAITSPAPSPEMNFRDIPGISDKEIAAIEALQARNTPLRYVMLHTSEAFIRPDGSIGGFSALFAAWMSQLFELDFQVEIVEWDELIQGLRDRSIDFTGELTSSRERRKTYIMSDNFNSRTIRVYRLRKSERIRQIARQRTPRVAFLNGTTTTTKALNNIEVDVEPVFMAREGDAAQALLSGKVDAYVAEDAIFENSEIVGEELFPVIYTPVSLSTANPELAPIISAFNKYLKTDAPQQLIELHSRGKAEFLQYRLHYLLNTEERKYLAARQAGGRPVRLAAESDTYPSSFYNQREQQWQGIAHDVLEQISLLSGLRFEMVNTSEVLWPELLAMLESDQADMITELIQSPEREGKFLWADEAYAHDNYALISRHDYKDVTVQHILYSRVGFIKNSAYADVFNRWFPEHGNVREYNTAKDVFTALEKGEIDFALASRNLLLSMNNYAENPKFKANIIFEKTYKSGFGFNKDQQILCSIVSKAQTLVDMRGIEDRWVRKIFDYQEKNARNLMPVLYGATVVLTFLCLLMGVTLAWGYRRDKGLKQTVNARLGDLDKQTNLSRRSHSAANKFLNRVEAELREPLQKIQQLAEAEAAKQPDNPEQTGEIMLTARHLLGMLENLRTMARIENGEFKLEKQPFSLLDLMRRIADQTEYYCQEANIKFDCNIENLKNATLLGDSLRLRQVLLNLLENATRHSPPRGLVGFYVNYIEMPDENSATSARLRFEIRDSGKGLRQEQVEQIFTPLNQGDGTALALSYYLVREMNGELAVKSSPGHGSSFAFSICLPRA